MDVIPYSTTFDLKLFKDSNSQLFVQTSYNNEPVVLDNCEGQEMCPFELWHVHIKSKVILDG